MIRLTWFTRRSTTHKSTPKLRTTLSLNQLESREVPASLKGLSAAAAHANPNALAHANAHAAVIRPVSPTQSSTISGLVQLDSGAGAEAPYFESTVTLSINGIVVQTVNANPDGSYSFTVTLDQSATYSLQANMADGSSLYAANSLSGNLLPGQQITGQDLLFLPSE